MIEMDSKEIQTEAGSITKTIALWIQDFLIGLGVPEQGIIYTKLIVLFALVVIIVLCLQYLLRRILLFVFHRAVNITKLSFINYTIENRLPHYLALIGPYSFVRGTIPVIFYDFHTMINPMLKATDVYMVFMVIWIIM